MSRLSYDAFIKSKETSGSLTRPLSNSSTALSPKDALLALVSTRRLIKAEQ
ncbi:hypothetical protein Ddye_019833 [Dipteronia dyeriana]|uniref:Uncharacterized protein n=1 Tax=Dipteronia dyeriana TaxID=168575 RepID=A0AAD9TZ45_9ROSI|nr:hypothetical protein Ddye_019833 [Dipteronia dyeriana]